MELLLRSLPITETEKGANLNAFAKTSIKPRAPINETVLKSIRSKLDFYIKNNAVAGEKPSLGGFILDFPEHSADHERIFFYKHVAGLIASFGAALRLPSHRVLVLLPREMDCALVAHRLCANLLSQPLLFFEADNSADIIELIKNY
jgi:hypothetical protein